MPGFISISRRSFTSSSLALFLGISERKEAVEKELFTAMNRQRRLHGAKDLRWNDALAREARLQSFSMWEHGFFSHEDPVRGNPTTRLRRAGIVWRGCAENLFREQGYRDPVKAAMEGWMASPGHRQNLLDAKFTQSGMGVMIGPFDEFFMTQIFVLP